MKLKEQTKPTEDKPNNQSRATIIFNDLINKRKELMSKLCNSVDYSNLNFKHVDPKYNDVSFYEYTDSKELFNAIKNDEIRFDETRKKEDEFWNKLSNIKTGKKTSKQKGVINDITRFYNSREEIINSFRDYGKMILDAIQKSKQNETKEKGLKKLKP